MRIVIATAPKEFIRASQSGDWDIGENVILVSVRDDIESAESTLAIAIHELVEAFLCRRNGITDKQVVDFDTKFESLRAKDNNDEPGDDPAAPYRKEHQAATHVERAVCSALGIKWEEHDNAVGSL